MKSTDVKVTQDGKIVIHGDIVGFLDDETVYVYENGSSRPIGTFDHRSEIVSIVLDWLNGRR